MTPNLPFEEQIKRDVPVWDELDNDDELTFIVATGYPEKIYWICIESEENISTLKKIFSVYKIKYPDRASFEELKTIFKKEFRRINLVNELGLDLTFSLSLMGRKVSDDR